MLRGTSHLWLFPLLLKSNYSKISFLGYFGKCEIISLCIYSFGFLPETVCKYTKRFSIPNDFSKKIRKKMIIWKYSNLCSVLILYIEKRYITPTKSHFAEKTLSIWAEACNGKPRNGHIPHHIASSEIIIETTKK